MKYIYILFPISFILLFFASKYGNIISTHSYSIEGEHQYSIETDSSSAAKIKFDYYEFDAGDVPEGPRIEFEFPFTNIGEYPLVIQHCKSSCGCVLPICEDHFVLPGERGVFKAKHMTKGHTGYTKKTITMSANTKPKRTVLRLEAHIIPAEKK